MDGRSTRTARIPPSVVVAGFVVFDEGLPFRAPSHDPKDVPVHDDTAPDDLPRRTVLTGAAWAVPAIVATTSLPAFAATNAPQLAVTTPRMQAVAQGDTNVTVTVDDAAGVPASSGVVSLTGPQGVAFSPPTPFVEHGTARSTMSTTDPWALPGSTLDITAISGGGSTTVGLTILGADALATGANGLSPNHFTRDVDGTGAAGTGSMNPIIVTPTQVLLAFPSRVVSVVQGAGLRRVRVLARALPGRNGLHVPFRDSATIDILASGALNGTVFSLR